MNTPAYRVYIGVCMCVCVYVFVYVCAYVYVWMCLLQLIGGGARSWPCHVEWVLWDVCVCVCVCVFMCACICGCVCYSWWGRSRTLTLSCWVSSLRCMSSSWTQCCLLKMEWCKWYWRLHCYVNYWPFFKLINNSVEIQSKQYYDQIDWLNGNHTTVFKFTKIIGVQASEIKITFAQQCSKCVSEELERPSFLMGLGQIFIY